MLTKESGAASIATRVAPIARLYSAGCGQFIKALGGLDSGLYSNISAHAAKRKAERILGELTANTQKWAESVSKEASLDLAELNLKLLGALKKYLAIRYYGARQIESKTGDAEVSRRIADGILWGLNFTPPYAEDLAWRHVRRARVEAVFAGRRVTPIISSGESLALVRRFLDENEPGVIGVLNKLWDEQAELFSISLIERMLRADEPDAGLLKELSRMNRRVVRDNIMALASQGMFEASTDIERRIQNTGLMPRPKQKRIKYHQYFSGTEAAIIAYITQRGAELVTAINADQRAVIKAMIEIGRKYETGPYTLSRIIKPCVGLTDRFAQAVGSKLTSLLDKGIAMDEALKEAEAYARFLHDVRARNIARTELAEAYGEGQLQTIRDAAAELGAKIKKEWMASDDERTCSKCGGADGEVVDLNAEFSTGTQRNPAHPECRCGVGYAMVTE